MWRLIQRYVTDRCSVSEERKVERWMEEDPANRKLVEELEQIWSLTPEEDFEMSVQDAWDRFRIREMRGPLSNKKKRNRTRTSSGSRRMVTMFRAAAAILLMVFVGFFSWQYLADQGTEEQTYQEQKQNIETQKGEKAQISFSDGTVVTLNAASSLRYPKQFKGSKREVYLTGEAYFEVASNADKSFVVHTSRADVEVLGTKFNVRAWKEDAAVDVGVREGKVAVSTAENGRQRDRVLLGRGQFTSVIEGEGISDVRNIDVDKHLLWLNGGMYFDNVPFKQVFLQIERKFDVHISVSATESILEVPFTSTFRDRELSKILQVLSASMKMEYRREGNEIEFYRPKNSN
ncbi:FecR family protein [Fodinibius roseus]|uniref:FecR family protein n=2 Tax=Fodinibius roseus TaxID=1194090 RepID=A0A1M5EYI4_9BACT|nr:FecR family protein [Fodinibius roseus]